MVKESKDLNEIKIGLILVVKIMIWVGTVALVVVCTLQVFSSLYLILYLCYDDNKCIPFY